MKIKTWIKYEESYIPPRCRKPRYNEREEYVNINLPEATASDLQLAFEDKSYFGVGKIFFYRGKLWAQAKLRNPSWAEEQGFQSPLDELVYNHEHCSTYFRFHWDRECGEDTTRSGVIKKARADMRRYLLVDGVLYERVSEPRYCIYTFGLGHNHGGTSLSVDYRYNSNISKKRYFSALQGAEAVAEATRIALGRGDTESVHRFKADIEVFMPEFVKINPKKQHGNGNSLINAMEGVISATPDALTAGLFCIATAAAALK